MTLVLLAAGLGSRFGGDKQISHVGPDGQMLMEYTAYDAIEAGFDHIVFILKADMVDTVRRTLGDRIARRARVSYAVQDYTSLPDFYTVPQGRVKPFGTVHAVLCAADVVPADDCFATVNADDYYGREAFRRMASLLRALPASGEAGMVTYRLGNTLSENGGVTRGLCRTAGGFLCDICETRGIEIDAQGRAIANGAVLDASTPVSMNFWGFRGSMLPLMRDYFHAFLRTLTPEQVTAECLLPVMVGDMLADGSLRMHVDTSDAQWFGMTYREDKQQVADKLATLHEQNLYPQTLFD